MTKTVYTKLCDDCDTVRHCCRYGCVPKQKAPRELWSPFNSLLARTWIWFSTTGAIACALGFIFRSLTA